MNFDAFDSTIKAEIREGWNAMDDTPHMKGKEVISVHVAKFRNKKGVKLNVFLESTIIF
jgi:hypothetical protein